MPDPQPVPAELRLGEKPIPLSEVPRLLPTRNGKKVHKNTIRRWLTRGVAGVRLEGRKYGRTWTTTAAALDQFTKTLAENAAHPGSAAASSESPATPEQSARRDEVARRLEAAGL